MAWIVVAAAGVLLAIAGAGVMMTRPPDTTPVSTPAPASPGVSGKAEPGETVNIVAGDTDWPCYASAEAFQDLAKWILLDDKKNVSKTLRDGHSINLTAGMPVKILDADFGRRKIRVLDTGRECWVTIEALAPGSN